MACQDTMTGEFLAAVDQVQAHINRLQRAVDDHFDRDPENIDYGDIGDMNNLIEKLVELPCLEGWPLVATEDDDEICECGRRTADCAHDPDQPNSEHQDVE